MEEQDLLEDRIVDRLMDRISEKLGALALFNTLDQQYLNYKSPVTVTAAAYSQLDTDYSLIANRAGTVTLTLISAPTRSGKLLLVKTIQNQTVVSASANVVPLIGGAAATGILAAAAGKWALLQSDGVNWVIIAAA